MAGQLKKKSEKSGRGQPSQTSKNGEIILGFSSEFL